MRQQSGRFGCVIRSSVNQGILPRVQVLALVLGLMFAAGFAAWADEAEDQYLQIVQLIQQADATVAKGKIDAGLVRYQEAQNALQKFRRAYPDWNATVVTYRLKYVADKIQSATQAASPSTPQPGQAVAGNPNAGGGRVQIRLLEAGSEPRRPLRFHPAAGDKQEVAMKLTTSMTMKVGGVENPTVTLPGVTLQMVIEILDVTKDGDIHYKAMMGDAVIAEASGTTPQMGDALKSALSGLKGLSVEGTASSRGVQQALEIKVPAGANPQMRQTIEQMRQSFETFCTPLPEEAVGPGAQWEAKTPIRSQGILIDQTCTYQLVSLQEEQVLAKATLSQTASNQKIQNPAMPGLKLDLTSLKGGGTGDLTMDLTRIVASKASFLLRTDMTMGMNVGGQNQTMDMKSEVSLEMESK
jgi:hypothetical protein